MEDIQFEKFLKNITSTHADDVTVLSEKNHAILHIILDTLIEDKDTDAESVGMYREIKQQLVATMEVFKDD